MSDQDDGAAFEHERFVRSLVALAEHLGKFEAEELLREFGRNPQLAEALVSAVMTAAATHTQLPDAIGDAVLVHQYWLARRGPKAAGRLTLFQFMAAHRKTHDKIRSLEAKLKTMDGDDPLREALRYQLLRLKKKAGLPPGKRGRPTH